MYWAGALVVSVVALVDKTAAAAIAIAIEVARVTALAAQCAIPATAMSDGSREAERLAGREPLSSMRRERSKWATIFFRAHSPNLALTTLNTEHAGHQKGRI